MRIFIISQYPLPELENPNADLLVDDVIDLFQDNKTCAFNDKQVALNKIQTGDAKFIYSITVEKL